MERWLSGAEEWGYGPVARWCEYRGGELVQFVRDEGEVLSGIILYASVDESRGAAVLPQVVLIVVTVCGDEWWISPASVVIPG